MSKRPNIVLCTCDQLRAFTAGCYGNPVVRTPNMDRLAAGGVRFETAVTSFPVCMAARSVLLSGQYNRTCTGGVWNVAHRIEGGGGILPEYPAAGRPHLKDPTLPEILRENGYRNAVIGKWHIHSWPQDVGFDEYLIPRVHHCHTGQHYTENGGPEFCVPGYSVDFEADRVERFIEEAQDEARPFFLYYNISPPHCPMSDAPQKYTRMYDPTAVPLRGNVNPEQRIDRQDHWFKVYCWDFRYYQFHLPYTETLPPDFTIRDVTALYYGMTTWVDDALGRMLGALEKHGLADDTVVVFTSDHGDNLGSHGLVQKGQPIEESIRIPLLARWPDRMPAGRVATESVAGLVDIAPTLLSLLDIPVPSHMAGRDLTPDLRGSGPVKPAHVFFEAHGAGVRTPTHMYFVPQTDSPRVLAERPSHFYHVADDPFELQNLAETAMDSRVARELDRCLREWDAGTPWMPSPESES